MGADRHEKIQQRAYQIWEREGRPDGQHERHWRQAIDELDRDELEYHGQTVPETVYGTDVSGETVSPGQARKRDTGRVAKDDVLAQEALAIKTGISGDEAQRLIDAAGGDLDAAEQAARVEAGRTD
jgi:hypothetical protein